MTSTLSSGDTPMDREPGPATDLNKGARLVHRVSIAASVEEVWRAITEPAFTEQYFFALSVRSDWRIGSRIDYETPDGEAFMSGRASADRLMAQLTTGSCLCLPFRASAHPRAIRLPRATRIDDEGHRCGEDQRPEHSATAWT